MAADRIAESGRPSPFGNISNVAWVLMLVPTFLALTSLLLAEPAPERSPRDLLEQGLLQESIHGDFQAALQSYKEVLAHSNVGPRTRTEALFRLAECQEVLASPLASWIRYHEVTQQPNSTDFHQEAFVSKVSLLIEIAEEETLFNAVQFHYLGDLFIGLDGALQQTESERALSLINAASVPLQALLKEAESFSDHRLLKEMQASISKAAAWVGENEFSQALSYLRTRPFFTAFLEREALADQDEVFGYALEQLDQVVIALNANDDILALERWQAMKDYLAPLTPWPKEDDTTGTRRTYLDKVNKLLIQLESHIVKSQLSEARRLVDAFTQEQAKDGGMVHWHLDSFMDQEFGNPDVLPHYAAVTLHLEAAADALQNEELATTGTHLEKAEACLQKLQTLKTNTSDEATAADKLSTLESMSQLLRSGKIDRLRRLLEE